MLACDFFTVETPSASAASMCSSSSSSDSRRVHLAGCTAEPERAWVAQQARDLVWSVTESPTPLRFLIHDRDSKFTNAFDEVFRSEGISIIRTPVKAPKANAFADASSARYGASALTGC